MGVRVTRQQNNLKEKHARRPHPRPAAEPRQNIFANERLDLEQEESPREYCQRVRCHAVPLCRYGRPVASANLSSPLNPDRNPNPNPNPPLLPIAFSTPLRPNSPDAYSLNS